MLTHRTRSAVTLRPRWASAVTSWPPLAAHLVEWLGLSSVLDTGCGIDRVAVELAGGVPRWVGCEPQPGNVGRGPAQGP